MTCGRIRCWHLLFDNSWWVVKHHLISSSLDQWWPATPSGKSAILHTFGPFLWRKVEPLVPINRCWKFSTKLTKILVKCCQNFSKRNRPQPPQIRAPNSTKPKQNFVKNPWVHATGFALLLGSNFVKFFLSKTAKAVGQGCVNPKKKFRVFTN